MKFGVHLPLIDFTGRPFSLQLLLAVARRAKELGYTGLAANDHLVFGRPWLDGPAALSAVLAESGEMTLATTVALPVVRGPLATAKTLGALSILSGGRLVAGVGPGSSSRDYEAVGIEFEERWPRFDESVGALRALLSGDQGYRGQFYSTEGISLEPRPAAVTPIWIGSWGSDAGLKRVARLADGWLASAYNTTPEQFRESKARLAELLVARGRDGEGFPNALATTVFYLTDSAPERERMVGEVVAKALNRPAELLSERLLIGSAGEVREKVARYEEAGLDTMYLWPVADEVAQIEAFASDVAGDSLQKRG